MDSHHEEMMAIMKAPLGKTGQERIEDEIKPYMEEMNVSDFEANPEEIEAIPEHRGVPTEDATVEMVGTVKDWSVNQCLAVRRRGWLTHCAVPAECKGRSHKRPDGPEERMEGTGMQQRHREQIKKSSYI
jgi:hypothetical protein